VFPVVGVAESSTVAPLIAFPTPSFTVTVSVATPVPVVIVVGAAPSVETAPEIGPGVTVTGALWVIAVPFAVAESDLAPAAVAVSVAVNTPFASAVPEAGVTVAPAAGVTVSATAAPPTPVPLASRAVTVMVALPLPATNEPGAAVTLESPASTVGPGAITVTVAV